VLLAKGLLKVLTGPAKTGPVSTARDLERLQQQAENQIQRAERTACWAATRDAILATDDKAAAKLLNSAVLRAWLLSQLDEYNIEEADLARAMGCTLDEGCDANDALAQHAKSMGQAALLRAAAIVMMDSEQGVSDYEPTILNALAATVDVPLKNIAKAAAAEVKAEYAAKIATVKKSLQPTAPLAQPSTSPATAKPKAGANPPAKAKAAAKLTAEEASSGIAQAMQDAEERAPAAAPEVPQPYPGDSFAVGQRVRVTTDSDKLTRIAAKWAGKEGTITKREEGGGYWDVTFKGRGGGISMFADDQLELVEVVPA